MLEDYKILFEQPEFQDSLEKRNICLFLGSGVAFNLGMPDWFGLANKIVDFCMEEKIITRSEKINLLKTNNNLKIISICVEKIKTQKKEKEFNLLLEDIFYKTPLKKYRTSKIYKNLNKIYRKNEVLILQTNYDVMIEKYQTQEEGQNKSFYIYKYILSITNININEYTDNINTKCIIPQHILEQIIGLNNLSYDTQKEEAIIDISGKINADKGYLGYITKDNIYDSIKKIENTSLITFNSIEDVINNAEVLLCDITEDEELPIEKTLYNLKLRATRFSDKYTINSYDKQGIIIKPKAKSKKETLIIYSKHKEITQKKNIIYQNIIGREYIDKIKNLLRFELHLYNFERMRKYFHIEKNKCVILKDLLNSSAQPLRIRISELVTEVKPCA